MNNIIQHYLLSFFLLLLFSMTAQAATSAVKASSSVCGFFTPPRQSLTCSINAETLTCTYKFEKITGSGGCFTANQETSNTQASAALTHVWFPYTSWSGTIDIICTNTVSPSTECWTVTFGNLPPVFAINNDIDTDGVSNNSDNCLSVANPTQTNFDGDALGDACDTDDDNDGVLDVFDKFPLNAAASTDTDNDGYPNSWNAVCDANCQNNSGLIIDNCPFITNTNQLNTDADALGDVCDWDDDNDGVPDNIDAAPLNASNRSEITLPLNGIYKGGQLKGSSMGQ